VPDTSRRRRLRGAVALLTVLGSLVTGAATAPAGATTTGAGAVPSDGFYTPPAGWRAKRPGTVLRSRPAQLLLTTGLAGYSAWQLLYRSTSSTGEPMATVTAVIRPTGASAGLLSYQIPEDASAAKCAPSRQLATYDDLLNAVNIQQDLPSVLGALRRGMTVSIPDYEGPGSTFGAPRQPGYAVLDGVRASQRFAPLGLSARTPVVAMGYSGGSLATGWAAEVQATYAPEVRLTGASLGGFVTELRHNISSANGGLAAGLVASILPGILRAAPTTAAAFSEHLTPAGAALLAQSSTQCATQNLVQHAFLDLDDVLDEPFDDLWSSPAVAAELDGLALGSTPPRAPLFVYHAVNDSVVSVAGPDAIVPRYCAAGARVTYVRDLASEHASLNHLGGPTALDWLADRLVGSPAPAACTTTTVVTMALPLR
jgi:hypothetical protein